MARSGAASGLWLVAGVLLAAAVAPGAAKDNVNKLSLSERPKQTPGMKFKDAWAPKLIGTKAGKDYKPDKVDWASVIQAIRVICAQEMRICNWCTRECFHDGGANDLNDVAFVVGTASNQVITAPAGKGGFDASVMLNVSEQLRDENRYDSFSTFVAAVIRTLVGFYDISYSDGLAVCGAVAREMLSYNSIPVYSVMPAKDDSFLVASARTQPFLVGRLDTNAANGAGILPGASLTTEQAATWAKAHLARGIYDLLALLGSHATLDNKHCVRNNDTTGPFVNKQRMFSWNAPATYYTELLTPKLEGPIPDMDSEKYFRVDPPPKPLSIVEQERCKFTSKPFQDAAVTSVQATLANPNAPPSDPEPSFEWIDETLTLPADKPGDVQMGVSGRRRLAQVAGHPAALVGSSDAVASNMRRAAASRRSLAQADPAAVVVDPVPEVADPVVPEVLDPVPEPRPAGYRTRRTCDFNGTCYDGWPYTQNDGFMGQTAQLKVTAPQESLEAQVYAAVSAFRNPTTFNAAYGHAFVRLTNNGATFVRVNGKLGMAITGWECKGKWVSGDGGSKQKNDYCQKNCNVQKDDGKGRTLGCPSQLAEPYLDKVDNSKYNCRCDTAPWGQKATQFLTPNATQSVVGRVDLVATPSGIQGAVRKLLTRQSAARHHSAAHPHAGGGGGGGKAKCPYEALLRLGGFPNEPAAARLFPFDG